MIEKLLESVIVGSFRGGLYIILGLGISLILALTRIINVAHGSFLVLGAFSSYFFFNLFGIDPLLSMIIIFPVFFMGGFLILKYLLGVPEVLEVRGGGQASYMMLALIITIALSMVIRNLGIVLWTADIRSIQTFYSASALSFWNITFPLVYLLNFCIAVGIALTIYFFLKNTAFGMCLPPF